MNIYENTILWDSQEYLIKYAVTPAEKRNQGHPDNRLPDVPLDVEILSIKTNGEEVELSPHIINIFIKTAKKAFSHDTYPL